MFQHILFPVDFSPQSIDTIRHVRAWADRYGAKVSLLHTVEFGHRNYINWYAYIALVDLESVRNDARRRLKDIAASAFEGRDHHVELCEGDPASMITAYARDNNVDLIMMPTTGQGRLRRMLIGSVASKVLYDAACPVWTDTHRHGDEQPAATAGPVLCAVDATEPSAAIIRTAAQVAEAEKITLDWIHVIPSMWLDPETQPGTMENLQSVLEGSAREKLEALRVSCGVTAPARIVFGELPKVLREEAERTHARLLVIGRGHMHAVLGRLRTHVNAIIERAPCPVLSL